MGEYYGYVDKYARSDKASKLARNEYLSPLARAYYRALADKLSSVAARANASERPMPRRNDYNPRASGHARNDALQRGYENIREAEEALKAAEEAWRAADPKGYAKKEM